MPLALIAGVVSSKPKSDPFPDRGLPKCHVDIRVADETGVSSWRVIGYDMRIPELETLEVGDSVAIQGAHQLEASHAKNGCRAIVVTSIVATQILFLRAKSPNRLPVSMARSPLL